MVVRTVRDVFQLFGFSFVSNYLNSYRLRHHRVHGGKDFVYELAKIKEEEGRGVISTLRRAVKCVVGTDGTYPEIK